MEDNEYILPYLPSESKIIVVLIWREKNAFVRITAAFHVLQSMLIFFSKQAISERV